MINNARLVVISGKTLQKEVSITHFPFRIGRTRQADLPIPHSLVSRNHCEIDVEDDWLVVYDLGSSNGTRVNDERVESAYLQPEDQLTVGPLTFAARYDVLEEAPAEPLQGAGDTESSAVDLDVNDLLDSDDLSGAVDSDIVGGSAHDTDLDDAGAKADRVVREAIVEESDDADDADFNPAHLIADHKPDDEDSILDDDFDDLDDLDLSSSAVLGAHAVDAASDKPADGHDSVFNEAMQGLNVAPDSATAKKPTRGDSSEEPQFPLRLRLTDAGAIAKGTPVRAAGVEVGRVKAVSWTEADGQLYAEAQLTVQQRLAAVLRTDARVSIQQHEGQAVVMIESPGQQGPRAEAGQIYVLG